MSRGLGSWGGLQRQKACEGSYQPIVFNSPKRGCADGRAKLPEVLSERTRGKTEIVKTQLHMALRTLIYLKAGPAPRTWLDRRPPKLPPTLNNVVILVGSRHSLTQILTATTCMQDALTTPVTSHAAGVDSFMVSLERRLSGLSWAAFCHGF